MDGWIKRVDLYVIKDGRLTLLDKKGGLAIKGGPLTCLDKKGGLLKKGGGKIKRVGV